MRKGLFFTITAIFLAAVAAVFFLSQNQNVDKPSYSDKDFDQLVKEGHLHFNKMHLSGWRNAERFYRHAYKKNKSPQLRDRLFLTLCLIAVREKDEKIINTATYKKLDALSRFPRNRKQQLLFDMVQHYRSAKVFRNKKKELKAEHKEYVDIALFDIEKSPLDLYLYLYLTQYYSLPPDGYDERIAQLRDKKGIPGLIKKYSRTPLFIYDDFLKASYAADAVEKDHPQFAEFLLYRGNQAFKIKKYAAAFKYYRQALQLVPDYPGAVNGLGTIYYGIVHHYENAIEVYGKTLDLDPHNPVALFGKGVSLNKSDRLSASIRVFDRMLETQEMYHGEAYYFKAFNYFNMGLYDEARGMIERAREHLPHSGEVNALSGRLYLKEEKMLEAGGDFLRTLKDETYPSCYPLHFLGQIHFKAESPLFFHYFEESCRSFAEKQAEMAEEINKIDAMDIGAPLKKWMKMDRTLKYENFKAVSDAKIYQMQALMAQNIKNKPTVKTRKPGQAVNTVNISRGDSPLHMAAITGNIAEMEKLLREGTHVDARNKDGYTPLYWAALLGKTEAARYLVRKGANVNVQIDSGHTPLHEAVFAGRKEIARFLVANGASAYLKDELGKQPMELAVEYRREEFYELLKPIHRAVVSGDIETINQWLTRDPRLINTRDETGKTPLYIAAQKGDLELARRLIAEGADVNMPDSKGISMLYRVTRSGDKKMRELLSAHQAVLTDSDRLQRRLGQKETLIRHVARRGWLVKTANHVLVFDYIPVHRRVVFRLGASFIYSGNINPRVLKGRRVVSFLSHVPYKHPGVGAGFHWGRLIPDHTYVLGWPKQEDVDFKYIPGGTARRIGALDIRTVKTGEVGEECLGFLVKVDGLVIFHAGNNTCANEGEVGKFLERIRSVGGDWKKIDIAFLPVHGKDDHFQNRDTLHIIKELQPRAVYPLYAGGKDHYYREFAAAVEKENLKTVVHYAEHAARAPY
ncbi:MAG: hypothetical protein GY950_28545 [bacterium]|nr:hypothetical protein [bacterium]